MASITHLLRLVEAFSAARGVSEARTSTLVFNDGGRILDLRSGRDIGTRRLDRAIVWFSDHWPTNAAWPPDVPRPAPAPQEVAA
ncbi:hypothetical protein [uncultured Enterovirga sp.]|uniref:hypothetical protein n=1 Tax=uncultured Enterovirga sp. TaxID=2026352 RepID=UPI0035C999F1